MDSPIIESSNGNSGDNVQQQSNTTNTTASNTPTIPGTVSVAGCNIRVVCRVRPLTDLEKEKNERSIVNFNDSTSVSIRTNGPQFTFDRIFNFENSQQEVYEDVADPVVKDFLDGYHGTIIAYGQTASGKTHTMYGDPMNHGIIPRVMDNIFGGISKIRENDTTYSLAFCIKISALELYNEKLYDLFDSNRANLSIREHKQNGIYVEGISEVVVSRVEEAYEFLNISKDNRATASTNMSVASSRSHSILMIELSQQNLSTESSKISKLFLVDLAGSERANKTGVEGDRMQEAKNINLSLSALGKVINALTSGASYIPYRDSKLTRVLQDSLGGNSKTSLIINCSPSNNNEHETITTLQFGTRAKTIKNQPKINKKITYHELEVYIMRLSKELEKTCKERDEIIKSKNLEINNLLIQLENNQVTIVSNNQKLESLQQQQQQELERKEREKLVYIVDTEKSGSGGVVRGNNEQQQIDEQDDDNLSISSRHSSIILDDLKDLDDTPNIQDIINSTINQDDESSSGSDSESDNQIDLNGSSEIKIPIIDFNLTTTNVNNNNNNNNIGDNNVDNNLRVSTSYITSSPNVSPRLNSDNNNVDDIDDNLFSSSSSPIIISSFKNKDFSSLATGFSNGELNQILENGSDIGGGESKSSQDSDSEDDNDNGSGDEDDMKSSASTTTTTTTTTTIDMNANQPSSIEDPIEFTIIKSDKTVTSTLEKETIVQPCPSSIDNQQLLSSSSSLPAPQPITTSATLTTVTTTKITKTTNNIENIDINDDFGFSKIEDENVQLADGHKPNSLTSNFLFDDYEVNDNIINGEDEDEEYIDNNLLNSFSHRGDYGATPSSKLDFKNSGSNISTPIKDNGNIDTTTTTPSTIIQSTPSSTNVIESNLTSPSKQETNSTSSPSSTTSTKKKSSYLPMFIISTLLFLILTFGCIQYPEYKERLEQRRIYLDSIGIYSDYPTADKLLLVKRNQILFAKELYGNTNSPKYQQQITLINTAYNSLEQMNYLELVLSNFLNKSSINLRFSTDDYFIGKENELKRKINSLESSAASSSSSKSSNSGGSGNNQSINEIIEKFETEIKQKKNTIKELESKIDKLESQITIQKQVISSSSVDSAINTAEINKQIGALIEKIDKFEVDKKALATLLAKSETERKQLVEKKTELDKEKIELTDKFNNANKKINQLEQDSKNYPIALKESSITKAWSYLSTNTVEFVDYVSIKSIELKDNVQSNTNQFTQLLISYFKKITSKWFNKQ